MSEVQFRASNFKDFEKPATGMYHAVLADIVDIGDVPNTYKGVTKIQPMLYFVWILDAKDKEGRQFQIRERFNNSLTERSNLYKRLKQILNQAPSVDINPETLIGQTRKLFIQLDVVGEGTQQKKYTNVIGVSAADAGIAVSIPSDFVRDKLKPATEQAKTKYAQKYQQQQSAPATASVAAPAAAASAATPLTVEQLQAQLAAAQAALAAKQQGADVKF